MFLFYSALTNNHGYMIGVAAVICSKGLYVVCGLSGCMNGGLGVSVMKVRGVLGSLDWPEELSKLGLGGQ